MVNLTLIYDEKRPNSDFTKLGQVRHFQLRSQSGNAIYLIGLEFWVSFNANLCFIHAK
jgi:hypothetical protein